MNDCQTLIVGGGMLGSALAFGLSRVGSADGVLMLDQGDSSLRAARGNFGLLWAQGKGASLPAYADWTLRSCRLWPEFARELQALTGIDLQLRQQGGIHYCLSEQEQEAYGRELAQQAALSQGAFDYRLLDNEGLRKLEPHIGRSVPGGAYSPNDGHVNPLYLLRALHAGFIARGGRYRPNHQVQSILRTREGFVLHTEQGELRTERLILTAGLDNARLAPMVGLQQPLLSQRGQLLITERLPPLLNYPSIYLRQTGDGTLQIGDSAEPDAHDDRNTPEVMAELARRALLLLPMLEHRRIVRGWGALRILSPDGYPLYAAEDPSLGRARAFAFSAHSGVTLAAIHALELAPQLLRDGIPQPVSAFSPQRFEG
ncbi:NAD(P)/FAD-dependent oxidoreductase [Aestuariirhabdus litorea]|uniref:FAD-binding oxidoreductase n=1 Tax=Aestuariirhabdus litorea TaxID=2528527 RepID=A0A3P3VNR5_9GAMM|nr:FAD-dependent oxidoreductase [Aestuariirhabdus litorea]RRJ83987.1 FAD-binding oxidoreductase [Aestuariirhabdus litorea]RWW97207.1 FAD-dependent oxidoreductase [Endozoicomonadaceae bacterium GTF-13]